MFFLLEFFPGMETGISVLGVIIQIDPERDIYGNPKIIEIFKWTCGEKSFGDTFPTVLFKTAILQSRFMIFTKEESRGPIF